MSLEKIKDLFGRAAHAFRNVSESTAERVTGVDTESTATYKLKATPKYKTGLADVTLLIRGERFSPPAFTIPSIGYSLPEECYATVVEMGAFLPSDADKKLKDFRNGAHIADIFANVKNRDALFEKISEAELAFGILKPQPAGFFQPDSHPTLQALGYK